jgi:ABC-2 type transport system permease protein
METKLDRAMERGSGGAAETFPAASLFFLATATLLRREVVRFLRQRNRIVGALATPLVFWFLIGSGLGKSFRMPGGPAAPNGAELSYLQYFFPGTLIMILLFTAIFSTISIIEDRREGFLQGVLVAPVPRSAVVLGKILGGTLLAFGQGLLFLAAMPFLGISVGLGRFLFVCLVLLLMSFGLTGLGFLIAWRMESTQGFHAIMNLFLMPLWFLSGALFPVSGAPPWLGVAMRLNPLTYSLSALHRGFFSSIPELTASLPSASVCLLVTAFFAAAMFGLSVLAASANNGTSS